MPFFSSFFIKSLETNGKRFFKNFMKIFYFKKKFFLFLICFLLISAGLRLMDKKNTSNFFFPLYEIQALEARLRLKISNLAVKYLFLLDRYEKNKTLERENKILKSQNQLMESVAKENKRLKKLLNFPLNQKLKLLPAQITGTGFLSKNNLININKGRKDGVAKFMGVLHPDGLVGYIFRVSAYSSQVISLLNPLSSLPARNRNSRIKGLISAGKKDLLLFKHLDKEFFATKAHPYLKRGDPIVTIPSDQFPAGLLVGHILSVDHSSHRLNPKVYVKPAVPFHSLEEVLVVLSPVKGLKEKLNQPDLK